jgi:hypothetical protein
MTNPQRRLLRLKAAKRRAVSWLERESLQIRIEALAAFLARQHAAARGRQFRLNV